MIWDGVPYLYLNKRKTAAFNKLSVSIYTLGEDVFFPSRSA